MMLMRELLGKSTQRRSRRRFMDAVKEDMAVADMTEEDTDVRIAWR